MSLFGVRVRVRDMPFSITRTHSPIHDIHFLCYIDAASSASIVPEEEAIAWRMKYVSKSGEEYVIDLSLLPPSTTIFEVVQKLLYMCKRGERGGGEEISAANNNNHKSIVVGPEEWEHTYYIELNLKVLNHDHQLVKPKPKPNEDKDWIAPDVLHYSRTSFDATLHHMIRCFRDNKGNGRVCVCFTLWEMGDLFLLKC